LRLHLSNRCLNSDQSIAVVSHHGVWVVLLTHRKSNEHLSIIKHGCDTHVVSTTIRATRAKLDDSSGNIDVSVGRKSLCSEGYE